jgi:hypothetical protein
MNRISKAEVLRGLVEIAKKASGQTRLRALRLVNKELRVFPGGWNGKGSVEELEQLFSAAERYIFEPANNVDELVRIREAERERRLQ